MRAASPAGGATPLGLSASHGAAALLIAVTLLLPGWHPSDRMVLGALIVLLGLLSAAVLVVGMPRWLTHLLVGLDSLLVGVAMLAGGGAAISVVYGSFVVWVVLQAVILLPAWHAAGHVLLSAAVMAASLVLLGEGSRAASQTIVTVGMAVLVAVAVHVLLSRARSAAGLDELTGLPNRRTLARSLDNEFARFRRTGRPFSLLVLDLDGFKAINDERGHAAGDAVLVAVGRVWAAHIRAEDTLARVGGDEFVAVLAETDTATARAVVNRLIASTSSELSVSIGVATAATTDAGPAAIVARADEAMYRQKGRRRGAPTVPPPAVGHDVHFFDGRDALLDRLGPFIADGLDAGDACVVVATAEHRAALRRRLGERLDSARESGQFLELDAEETLSRILRDGMPDRARFDTDVGQLVRNRAADRPVRVYGEMVALLWTRGDVVAALALEDLWNDLGDRELFALLCAYPADQHGMDADGLVQICTRHDAVSRSDA